MIPNQAYLDAVAGALDLTVGDEDRADVLDNLRLIFRQSAGFLALPLDIEDEAATVFIP